jgi:hypothetical protein
MGATAGWPLQLIWFPAAFLTAFVVLGHDILTFSSRWWLSTPTDVFLCRQVVTTGAADKL